MGAKGSPSGYGGAGHLVVNVVILGEDGSVVGD